MKKILLTVAMLLSAAGIQAITKPLNITPSGSGSLSASPSGPQINNTGRTVTIAHPVMQGFGSVRPGEIIPSGWGIVDLSQYNNPKG